MLADATEILCQNFDNYMPFVENGKTISFSQYKHDVIHYTAALKKEKSKNVILYFPNDLYLFYVCFMACLHAEKDVILPSFLTNTNIENLKETSSFLLTTEKLSSPNFKILNPKEIKADEQLTLQSIQNRYVSFFTSGSTGTPKQIEKNFLTLSKEVRMHSLLQQSVILHNPVVIATVLPYHMYGMLWRFLFTLCNGLTQELDTAFSPEEIQQKQSLHTKIALITTPSFMNELIAYHDQYTFKNNCIAVYSSGSLLRSKTSKGMQDLFGVSPFEIFGSTETGGIAYRQQKDGNLWHLFPDVHIDVLQDSTFSVDSDFCYQRPYLMQDSISLQKDGTFLLNGRVDRLVKIAENRISLPEMEEKLIELFYIKQAYLIPIETQKGITLGAMITLTEEGKKTLCQFGKNELVKKIKTYLSDWYEKTALPKKFRFVQQIPTNTQGKIIKNQVLHFFQSKLTEPVMDNIKISPFKISMDLIFLKDSPYFEGHFPEYPILPGVIQTHFAFEFLRTFFKKTPTQYTLSKLKFSALILPQISVHFEMEKLSEEEYFFIYKNGEKIYSSGKIVTEDKDV